MADYYQTLGISPQATNREIRSAYRRLARQHHPDVSHTPEAQEQFSQISEAYRVLANSKLRALYDEGGLDKLARHRHTDHLRHQREAFRTRINNVVDEMLAQDLAETHARGQAITILVTLFGSAFFAAAFAKPMGIKPIGLFSYLVIMLLFILGSYTVYQNMGNIIKKYTYTPITPSVTRLTELPKQPFSRNFALVFLIVGYLVSISLGSMTGYCCLYDGHDATYFDNGYLVNIILVPPVAVFITDLWRMFSHKFNQFFNI